MAENSSSLANLTPQERRARLLHLLVKKEQGTKLAPLSFSQERFWIQEQLAPGSINSLSFTARIRGDLKVAILEQSLTEIVRRHDSLRTSIMVVNGQPMQSIKAAQPFQLPVITLEHFPVAAREAEARRISAEELGRPFDIVQGPLFRATLLRLDATDHVLILIMQHLISDAWSLSILIKELSVLYEAFSAGQPSPLPPLPLQYADFAQWQREKMQDEILEREVTYWIKQLGDSSSILALPTDRPRVYAQTTRGAHEPVTLSLILREQLKTLAQQEGCTLFMVLLAGLQVLLQRYTEQADINVCTVIANRTITDTEKMIGLFLNLLVLRADLRRDPTFVEVLHQARQTTLEAYDHQEVPFQKMLEALQAQPGFERESLFQVLLLLQNIPTPTVNLSDLTCQRFMREMDFQSEMDLSLSLVETEEGLTGYLEYKTDLFDASTMQRLLGHYQTLLEAVVNNPGQRISELPFLTNAELQQILVDWNDTGTDYPQERCIHELFESQAACTPDAVAVVFEQQHLTYRELNQRANQLARYLRKLGVGTDMLIGLCLERSVDMIVGLLGILKAGGAYVPLDPTYLAQRLDFILEDTQIKLLLSHSELASLLSTRQATVVFVDLAQEITTQEVGNLPEVITGPDQLAYVIYTSGSTGRPKGVMIPHSALAQYAMAAIQHFDLTPQDGVLQFASISFDAAAEEIYPCLLSGARLILRTDRMLDSSETFLQHCAAQGITVLDLPTAYWHTLVAQWETASSGFPAGLRLIILGGEAALAERVTAWHKLAPRHIRLINTYGPTETTIVATQCDLTREVAEKVPIGKPVANTRVYVLDPNLQPVPVGVPGELYIGGADLARGYFHQPALTAAAFIPDRFGKIPGARVYKTGDLVRYLPDGQLQFLGRADRQVKVRGFRIEPGEIESALTQYPTVREAVVLAHEDQPGDKYLIAYVVPHHQATCEPGELRHFLQDRLPSYMIPATFMVVETLPLTSSGKIDHRALPLPTLEPQQEKYVPPSTPVEIKLAAIWSQVMNLKTIGICDNFFDLGGHSIVATQIIFRINQAFRLNLTLRSIFEEPTIAGLALLVEEQLLEEISPNHEIGSKPGHEDQLAPSTARLAARRATLSPEAARLLEQRLQGIQAAQDDQAIPRASRQGDLVLSFAQQRLWFLDQLVPGSTAYHIPQAVRLLGAVNLPAFERSLNEIVRRHEGLRTTFTLKGDQPVQVIVPDLTLSLPVVDLAARTPADQAAELQQLLQTEALRLFDLTRGPLVRVTLIKLAAQEHVLLVVMHHIVSDGWSIGVFVRELMAIYLAFCAGRPSPLPNLPIQYADYALWQRQWLSGEMLEQPIVYWKRQFSGELPTLQLPTDHPRPLVQTFRGAKQTFTVPADVTATLLMVARNADVTLFMLLLAAFQTLLYRHTGQTDLIIGTPIFNRTRKETEDLIGFFVNTLALRVDLAGNPAFVDLLKRVREVSLGAYAHQDLPFDRLVDELHLHRDLSYTPLFQVMFALQNAPMPAFDLPGLTVLPLEMDNHAAQFDLTLSMTELPQGLLGMVEYNTDLYEAATIQRLIVHFQTLLVSIAHHPQQRLSDLNLLTELDQQQLLYDWNNAARSILPTGLVHRRVEEQACQQPDALAVVGADQHLTYGELNRRATQLAQRLQQLGVGPEVLVGICLNRSVEMLVASLGVLKAGGAYLPLDPAYPPERLAFMLNDSGAPVLLTQPELVALFPEVIARLVTLPLAESNDAAPVPSTPDVTEQNLAYVIYTSGSTGRPKGVMIQQRSLMNLVQWHQRVFGVSATDRATQLAGWSFDASVWEVWPYLAGGASVHLPDEETRLSPAQLQAWLMAEHITICFVPTPLTEALLALAWPGPASLRTLLTGGDQLHERPTPLLSFELINNYGPTETTVVASSIQICAAESGGRAPTIGRPIDNAQIYLLDNHLQPVPVGVLGELYIGGDGVARGYLARPDLTAERFLPDPFSRASGARLYRTGDLARYLPDGQLEFGGRLDQQVKVRGFRIELGEIETILNRHPAIQQAVVITCSLNGSESDKQLVAYLVPRGVAPTSSELRSYLQAQLPDYMLPAAFVTLETLPLTPNGKLDRRALPALDQVQTTEANPYVAPCTPLEKELATIWADVLHLKQIGIHDNFFERGGHSLLATQMVSRVSRTLKIDLPLRTLFEAPTIAEMATRLERLVHTSAADQLTLKPRLQLDQRPLSFSQERLWFLDQLDPGSTAYNMPFAIRLQGALNVTVLEQSLQALVRRHEILRTTFGQHDGQPIQVIVPRASLPLPLIDLAEVGPLDQAARAQALIQEEAQRPFDLSRGPLLRARLLRLSDQDYVLMLTLHHIISDGWSIGVFVHELTTLYQAFSAGQLSPLPELPIQYADYAVWQRQWLAGERLAQQVAYWQQQFSGEIPTLDLPTDHPRPPVQTFQGAVHNFTVAPALSQQLNALSRETGVTLFMTLLAAFQTLLHRYTGQTDLVIGTPIANRTRVETESLIGFFVNTLALRVDLAGNPTFRTLLTRVREVTLGAYAHQDLPFDRLVDELHVPRDLSRTPLFQVMFALQNAPMPPINLPGLRIQPVEANSATAKFDLTLFLTETADGLLGQFEYNTDLLSPATLEHMTAHLLRLLNSLVQQPDARLSELALLTEAEQHQLLVEWNDTRLIYPAERRLHDWFEAQVAHTPDAVAVVFDAGHLTYRNLNQRANQLAHHLQRLGVGPEVLVGLCLERSPEMLVGLLGILKAGGAYVPLDPDYPSERLAFMLADTHTPLVLTQAALCERLPAQTARLFCLDRDWHTVAALNSDDLPHTALAQNLAYVIYTSGSTGRPKGVAIPHRNAVALVAWARQCFAPAHFNAVLAATSICFDLSIFELFATWSSGGTVILAQNALQLPHLPAAQRVTLVNTVPSAAQELWRSDGLPDSVRVINLAGEPLPQALVEELYQRPSLEHVFDLYGPSETTTYSTYARRQPGGHATIGRPISNTQVYLLDAYLNPVPLGARGEIFIGGAGVTRGYLQRPDLTAERFLPDPFNPEPGARLYRTGDLARYTPEGNIEFLGRHDQQVKVRGFRIELGEIEARLNQHPAVQQALVIARAEPDGDKRLVAYLLTSKPEQLSIGEVRQFVQRTLPDYMLPAVVVPLAAFPLTPNGKLDRRALPPPEQGGLQSNGAPVAARDIVEARLIQIWQDLLGVRPIGIHDNFFERGGHSLRAVQLMARIEQEWSVQLPIASLFQGATVEQLAAVLRQRRQSSADASLVMIQKGAVDQGPLFLVHPSGGHVLSYAALARALGPAQPCYGFQARGLDDERELATDLETMAEHYVALLRSVQAEGPYRLGGWSVGGVIAFEMAQQLKAAGQTVELLALIDSYVPNPDAPPEDELAQLAAFAFNLGVAWQTMPFDPDQLRDLLPDERLPYLLAQAHHAQLIPGEIDLNRMRRLYQVFQNNIHVVERYTPRPYTGSISLFKASEQIDGQATGPEAGWQPLALGGLDVQEIPGQHYTLLHDPNVIFLAEHLKAQLQLTTLSPR